MKIQSGAKKVESQNLSRRLCPIIQLFKKATCSRLLTFTVTFFHIVVSSHERCLCFLVDHCQHTKVSFYLVSLQHLLRLLPVVAANPYWNGITQLLCLGSHLIGNCWRSGTFSFYKQSWISSTHYLFMILLCFLFYWMMMTKDFLISNLFICLHTENTRTKSRHRASGYILFHTRFSQNLLNACLFFWQTLVSKQLFLR